MENYATHIYKFCYKLRSPNVWGNCCPKCLQFQLDQFRFQNHRLPIVKLIRRKD